MRVQGLKRIGKVWQWLRCHVMLHQARDRLSHYLSVVLLPNLNSPAHYSYLSTTNDKWTSFSPSLVLQNFHSMTTPLTPPPNHTKPSASPIPGAETRVLNQICLC
jgi:hypothetical protein